MIGKIYSLRLHQFVESNIQDKFVRSSLFKSKGIQGFRETRHFKIINLCLEMHHAFDIYRMFIKPVKKFITRILKIVVTSYTYHLKEKFAKFFCHYKDSMQALQVTRHMSTRKLSFYHLMGEGESICQVTHGAHSKSL